MNGDRGKSLALWMFVIIQSMVILYFAIDYTYRSQINKINTNLYALDANIAQRINKVDANTAFIVEYMKNDNPDLLRLLLQKTQEKGVQNESVKAQKPGDKKIDEESKSDAPGKTKKEKGTD